MVMPGIDAVRCFSRSITTEMSSCRSPRGRSVITRRPTLVVGLTEPAPITETTPTTSGSAWIAAAAAACRLCISAKETSGPASVTAVIDAVSCSGKKPFGAITYKHKRRGDGRERHHQRRALALQHPQ